MPEWLIWTLLGIGAYCTVTVTLVGFLMFVKTKDMEMQPTLDQMVADKNAASQEIIRLPRAS